MKSVRWTFIHLLLLFVSGTVFSQRIEVNVPSTVTEGESFTLSYTLNDGELDDLDISSFGGFEVIGGPNRSSSLSIINGRRSSKTSVSYILLATKPGTFTIPSATVIANGKRINTNPATVTVQKGAQAGNQANTGSSSSDILLRTTVTPSTKIYLGQQALLGYDIYFRTGINLGNSLQTPDLSAFYYRDFSSSLYNQTQTKSINGKVYNYATVEKGALYAQKVGRFNIGRMKKTIGIEKGEEQDSDFGFFSRKVYDPAVVESDEMTIEVLPLPDNAPEDFINAVGKYTAEITVEKSQTGYNFILAVRGNGDERSLITPKLQGNGDVEIYNGTKLKSDEEIAEDFITHTTYYRYPVVFRKEGPVSLDCSISYFDTESKTYQKINLPVNYTVAPLASPDSANFESVNSSTSTMPAWVAGLIGAVIAGVIALGVIVWYQRKKNTNEKEEEQTSVIRERRKVNLDTIRHSADPFAEARQKVMNRMQKLYGIEPKDQNRTYIHEYLTQTGKTEEAREVDAILEICEQAVYGGGNNEEARNRLLKHMSSLS